MKKISLILSTRMFFTFTTYLNQDLAKPFFIVPMNHQKKKIIILARVSMSNLLGKY